MSVIETSFAVQFSLIGVCPGVGTAAQLLSEIGPGQLTVGVRLGVAVGVLVGVFVGVAALAARGASTDNSKKEVTTAASVAALCGVRLPPP
jgi:hypothetical protein